MSNETAYLNGRGTDTLLLPAIPADVHSVEVGGATLVRGADYSVDGKAGILRATNGVWPDELGNVKVVYSHGWDEDDIPGDIQDAVLEHATTLVHVYAHLQQNSAGSTQESYLIAAQVGTTSKWVEAVSHYKVGG